MLLDVFPHLIPGFETCSPSARADSNVPSPCTGLCVQPLGCRNRMNNGCAIGALFPAVSTWIAGALKLGLSPNDVAVSRKRSGQKAPACAEGSSLYSRVQLTC